MRLPEQNRITHGPLRSEKNNPNEGAFLIPCLPGKPKDWRFLCIASNGMGWEHVSVSIFDLAKQRGTLIIPSWEEMCHIKDTFWHPEDAVIQVHPPASEYVNNHSAVLHLWRCIIPGVDFPLPPAILVGVPGINLT